MKKYKIFDKFCIIIECESRQRFREDFDVDSYSWRLRGIVMFYT